MLWLVVRSYSVQVLFNLSIKYYMGAGRNEVSKPNRYIVAGLLDINLYLCLSTWNNAKPLSDLSHNPFNINVIVFLSIV